ncbi:MAG: hypothetical protein A2Y66_00500 [Nitrospirae bacterium RBG_13_41_22]|nr:MAG: hypothetical protein A2Y66_00500 [Nitrospirae bacterium RBG_13_41_22]
MKLLKTVSLLSIAILLGASFMGCDGTSSKGPEKKEVGFFSESTQFLAPNQQLSFEGGKCNMETINGINWDINKVIFHQSDAVSIVGWGVDAQTKRAPSSIFIRVQSGGRAFYAKAASTERADVAQYFKEDYYKNSGYKADVSLKGLPQGEYHAMIVMTFPDKAILCASGRTLIVK